MARVDLGKAVHGRAQGGAERPIVGGRAAAQGHRTRDDAGVLGHVRRGEDEKVIHPVTEKETDRNPALLSSSRGEVPATLDDVALDRYIARGGIALACNLAFDDMIALVTKKDGTSGDAARKTALAGLVPGVNLQPSGVFAALHAQDAGCKYLRAS